MNANERSEAVGGVFEPKTKDDVVVDNPAKPEEKPAGKLLTFVPSIDGVSRVLDSNWVWFNGLPEPVGIGETVPGTNVVVASVVWDKGGRVTIRLEQER